MKRSVPALAASLLAAALAPAFAQAVPAPRSEEPRPARAAPPATAPDQGTARSAEAPQVTGSVPRQRTCVEARDGTERCQDLR